MAVSNEIRGACLCGALTFHAVAKKLEAGVCHCGMCQRWSAGPFLAIECVPGTLCISGREYLATYKSSLWAKRCFCKTCGSTLFWRSRLGKIDVVSAGVLDDKSKLAFTYEIFIDAKPSYYGFANPTKCMTGMQFVASMVTGRKSN